MYFLPYLHHRWYQVLQGLFFFFKDSLTSSPGRPRSHYVVEGDLEPLILQLPDPAGTWNLLCVDLISGRHAEKLSFQKAIDLQLHLSRK